ncbi:MAG: YihY/virulence factor BrkB family protein [Tahibacter sp.]
MSWLKKWLSDLVDDDLLTLAAAIAYSSTLALAPLVVLAIAILGSLHPASQASFVASLGDLVGPDGRRLLEQIVADASTKPDWRHLAGWLAGLLLLVSASAVLAQLQSAINRIWDLTAKADAGLWAFLRRRLFSAGLLLALVFLTILAQLVQTAMSVMPMPEFGAPALSWIFSSLVYLGLFAALYRWLPDRRLPWTTVLRAGLITSILFQLGRWAIVAYLAYAKPGAAFGAAGGLVVWLLWSFYSAVIFLSAAEAVYAFAHTRQWAWFSADVNASK